MEKMKELFSKFINDTKGQVYEIIIPAEEYDAHTTDIINHFLLYAEFNPDTTTITAKKESIIFCFDDGRSFSVYRG